MSSLLNVDSEIKRKVDAFRERITSEAEDLVANFFPKKLLELDHFLKEPVLNIRERKEIHLGWMTLMVPDDVPLLNLADLPDHGPEAVKMWVQLLIPRIEDGNNFGVSIQEETVAKIRLVEAEAASFLDQILRFKEDYRLTVLEIDETGTLHDMILKNIEKMKLLNALYCLGLQCRTQCHAE
ncbi:hypothetical protein NHX12_024572 [Muraenolepis orangiensis]|uniref:Proteasome activator complex subunit 3 n=1 Tax=Muraenolepis orangiensis TaxID=630683 RepID=A0A9Q0EIE8_9TELE|nr:hypothetical protein NHX12_024572 [Muraenolepis orangiensis]